MALQSVSRRLRYALRVESQRSAATRRTFYIRDWIQTINRHCETRCHCQSLWRMTVRWPGTVIQSRIHSPCALLCCASASLIQWRRLPNFTSHVNVIYLIMFSWMRKRITSAKCWFPYRRMEIRMTFANTCCWTSCELPIFRSLFLDMLCHLALTSSISLEALSKFSF